MLKQIFTGLFLIFSLSTLKSQVTTNPLLPVASQKVTVTFDTSKETRLGYYTGDLYSHTGVIIEGNSNWQHVIGTWGNNSVQPKLTNKGNGIYELEISPNINSFYSVPGTEKVIKLAFVFRSADAKKQTNDLFINVYQEGLVVEISQPVNNSIINKGQTVTISANASLPSSLRLLLDGAILSQTTGTSISTGKTFNESGNHWLIAEATASGETKYDSVYICIKENIVPEAKPDTYKKGINYPSDTSAALVLWAPGKEYIFVLGDFNDWRPMNEFQMKKDGEFFWLEMNNLEKGKEYVFQYFIDNEIKIADPYTEKISDPWNDEWITSETYPGLIVYPKGKTEGIASVLQPGQEKYNWEVTDFLPAEKGKMVIYELLIRDFTTEHSYQSVIDKLDYLEDLRINVLELMPVNEFEGNSSWGYNPSFYFAPDKYYGPKNDLKKLVDECHKRGIAVVIDMVLNHSYGQSPFVQMYMDDWTITSDNPWYNIASPNTTYSWGYDFNHEADAVKELIDSVNSFWMSEYKVDGFRFDFTKGFTNTPGDGWVYDASRITILKRMTDEIWKRNQDALVIFEHLSDNSEEKILADYGISLWGNMNGKYGEAAMGYNESSKSDLNWGVYKTRNWAEPNLVTYMESHDEERLAYKCLQYGKIDGDYNIKQLPVALNRMELNFVFQIPLPGPKMIWQFGERGYDISINDFGGRLSEKPPHWEYLEDTNRLGLFSTVAKLNYLKNTYDEFTPQVFSYDLAGEIKWYRLNTGNNHVFIVGNFGTQEKSTTLTFPVMGIWYEYFTNTTTNVDIPPQNLTLAPGEYRLYSTRQFENPHIKTDVKTMEISDQGFTVYPNPATDKINIVSATSFSKIIICSVAGDIKFSKEFNSKNRAVIDIQNYPPGLYIIRLESGSEVLNKKCIIQ